MCFDMWERFDMREIILFTNLIKVYVKIKFSKLNMPLGVDQPHVLVLLLSSKLDLDYR
jgi:hypothetical protein